MGRDDREGAKGAGRPLEHDPDDAPNRSELPTIEETLHFTALSAVDAWKHRPGLGTVGLIAAPAMLLARGVHVGLRLTGQLKDTSRDDGPLRERSALTLVLQVVRWGEQTPEMSELKRRAAEAESAVLALLARYPAPFPEYQTHDHDPF